MGNLFGKEKPLKEVLRENKRMISKAIRELDRERTGMEREEKRLISEIKKNAKAQQMPSVRILAKDLVRTRNFIAKSHEMRSHLQGSAIKLQTVKSHQAMAESMSNVTKAMAKMNKAVNSESIGKMMQDFAKENQKSELMQEMMGDAMDDAMADEGNAEQEDLIVNQVLDEIGISFDKQIPDAPGGVAAKGGEKDKVEEDKTPMGVGGDPAVSELEERLNNLRR